MSITELISNIEQFWFEFEEIFQFSVQDHYYLFIDHWVIFASEWKSQRTETTFWHNQQTNTCCTEYCPILQFLIKKTLKWIITQMLGKMHSIRKWSAKEFQHAGGRKEWSGQEGITVLSRNLYKKIEKHIKIKK